jgi:arylsulfatase A-like enzyme
VSPLLADMNVECDYHIYQPCLPQILQMLNKLEDADEKAKRAESESESEKAFASFKWKTAFMQSVTGNYDRQTDLMTAIGFGEDEFLAWSYLKNESNPLGVVDLPDINYYGMAEEAIEGYVRAMFKSAKENDERVFLGHLTSTTHHDFGLPEEVESVQMAGNAENEDLSSYLNAVGYVDSWLGRILKLLEEEGVAEETLLIVQGDHGLSIAERGTLTAYSNPHIGNYHIPLVFSHPKMPHIDVDEAVISSQILPTLLDLLVETGSLSTAGTEAISDLLHNYEGQSMIRPLHQYSEETGQGGWQFTVMNPGGSTVMVRDARNPHWRMMVPILGYYEWRFTNLEKDRHEVRPILTYDFDTFIPAIEEGYGEDAAKWAEEAVAVSKWWAEENHKRWRYES